MDPRQDRAERLPALYRSILDVVADLERRGDRTVAARARRDAVKAYGSWDDRTERRLLRLEADLRRAMAHPPNRRRRLPFSAPFARTRASGPAVADRAAEGAAPG